jgi:gliding motility-associated-like protein
MLDFTFDGYGGTAVDYQLFVATTNIASGPPVSVTGLTGVPQSETITGLAPGEYYVLLTEVDGPNAGCVYASPNFVVQQAPQLLAVTATTTNDNCNPAAGTITATGEYGLAPYLFQLESSPVGAPPTVATWTGANTSGVFNVDNGDYVVFIRDANDCIQSSAIITVGLDPTSAVAATLVDACVDQSAFQIEVELTTLGISPYFMSVDGGEFQTTTLTNLGDTVTVDGLSSGTHTVEVIDANGCGNGVQNVVITDPIGAGVAINAQPGCAMNDGIIDVSGIGGSGNYNFELYDSPGGTILVAGVTYNAGAGQLENVPGGTFIVRMTDTTTLCTTDTTVTLESAVVPVLDPSTVVHLECFGDTNGSILANLSPATAVNPPYTYELYTVSGGVPILFVAAQTSPLFSGLGALPAVDFYRVRVISGRNCDDTEDITINQPLDLLASVTNVTDFSCNAVSGAVNTASFTVTADPTTGTGPYYFSIDSGSYVVGGGTDSNEYTYTTSVSGTFTIDVRDSNGCAMAQFNQTIDPLNVMSLNVINIVPIDCITNLETITVDVTGSSGAPPANLSFQLLPSGTPQANGNFSFTVPGDYTIRVTDTDTSCFEEITHTVNPYELIDVVASLVTDATCSYSTDGQLQIDISGYTGTFDYQVLYNSGTPVVGAFGSDNATSDPYNFVIPQTLPGGSYTVSVTETAFPQCSDISNTVTIDAPEAIVVVEVSNTAANCNDHAIVVVQASGGTAGYTYAVLVDGSPAPTLPGDFTEDETLNLNPATSLLWDVYSRDVNGCISPVLDITISLDTTPDISLALVDACAVEGNFAITVSLDAINTGVAPYSLSLNGGAYQSISGFPYTYNGLSAGPYDIEVRDANGCSELENIVITPELLLEAEVLTQPSCGMNDGLIEFTVSGGSGANTVALFLGDGTTPSGIAPTANQFTGVPFGDYVVRVTDNTLGAPSNCYKTVALTLEEPTPVTLNTSQKTDITCFGDANGTITVSLVTPAAGVNDNPPYTYNIDNGVDPAITNSSGIFAALNPGTYAITVTSERGCVGTDSITIIEPTQLVATASATDFACAADNTVNVSVLTVDIPTTGTAPYTYSIDGTNFFTTNTFNIVDTGVVQNITATVRDNNGCIDTDVVTINPLPTITDVTVSQITAITCSNPEVARVTVTGGSGDFTYELLPSGPNQSLVSFTADFTLTTPGDYVFRITDNVTGCYFTTLPYTIAPYDLIEVISAPVSPVTCFGDTDGEMSIQINNYLGNYTYQIFDDTATAIGGVTATDTSVNPRTLTGLPAGNYYVEVIATDTPFCDDLSNTITIASPDAAVTLVEVSNINANCNIGAQVSVQANGGTPGYTYAFVPTATSPTGLFTPSASAVLTPASYPSDYDVYVQDSRGCTTFITVTVNEDPMPTVTAPAYATDQCTSDGTTYTFDVVGTGVAPLEYSIGSGYQTSTTITVSAPGNYTVTVRDANGCIATDTIDILPPLGLTAMATTQPSCALNDGVITVTANGGAGAGNYEFDLFDSANISVTAGLRQASNVFNGLAPGNYTAFVYDTSGTGCDTQVAITLETPTPVLFTYTQENVSCFGGADGSIEVILDPSNDNPPYTYTLDDGVNPPTVQASNLFTGLVQGSYNITVTSDRGCFDMQTVTITEPVAVDVTASATSFVCNPNNTISIATIIAIGTDGTAPYTYSINGTNFFTSNTFDVVDTGMVQNITVTIMDDNGCTDTTSVTIDPINTFTVAITQVVAISCTNPEEVLITVTDDGNPANNYTYELLPLGNPNGSEVPTASNVTTEFDLTAVGSYTFRITDTTTGCYFDTLPYEIAPYDLIEVTATSVDPVICFGDGNGSLEINITGYSGAYDYQVFDSADNPIGGVVSTDTSVNPRLISGLDGGNYYVRVTETAVPFCNDDTNMVTILSPDMPLTELTTVLAEVECTNDQGEIRVNPSGGYAPYDITLTNTSTGEVFDTQIDVSAAVFAGLDAGDYSVEVVDAGGCVILNSYPNLLVMPIPVTANAIPLNTALACYGDTTGTVSATNVINGSGSYEYQLNYYDALGTSIVFTSGRQTSPDFTDLGAGIYSITVSDGWNCDVVTNQVTITEPTLIEATLIRTDPLTCATGVEFELSATGGSGSYEYSLDNITFSPMTSNPMPLPDSGVFSAGTYQYYVRDLGSSCASVASNSITENAIMPLALIVDTSAAVINCNGEATAIIYASAEGGLGNYQYELYTDAALTLATRIAGPQSLGEFTGLIAGTYYVNVTSEDCTAPAEEVIIIQPEPLTYTEDIVNVSCFGNDNGSITVTLSGGSGGYQYSISPNLNQFDTVNTFTDLAPGDYTVIAQDMNGCFELLEYTIDQPEMLQLSATSTPEICIGEENGTITASITGGTAPYSTSLNDKSDYVQDRVNFTDLAAGSYLLFVIDAQGCETNTIIEVAPGVNLVATAEVVYECISDLPTNYLNVTMEDPTVLGSVMYALDSTDPADMQLTSDFRNMTPGIHSVTIAHANGCINTVDFEVLGFEPLTLELQNININEITAIATGGRGEYTFYFDDENNGQDNTYTIYRTDTYEVRVVDENGCEVIATIEMEFIDIEIPNFFTPDGDGQNDTWMPMNLEAFPEILMVIFDRYGREVYRMTREDSPWDGLYHNTELPTGDYWYVIKLKADRDDREFIGHFTLYR